jgi:dTDP-glucose 4,6-dehydratase
MQSYFEDDLKMILRNTKDCWGNLSNKTIFITGGTGFFGIWLLMSYLYANKTLTLNSNIILLTRNKNKFLNRYFWVNNYPEVSFIEGEIHDFQFPDFPIDFIIHAATEASAKLNEEEPLKMFNTIINGTKRVLDLAKLKNIKSILLTSSGAVYGKQPSEIEYLSENYLGAPIPSDYTSMYGEGKRMSEVLFSTYHHQYKLPVKIARCYAFIGPYLPLDSHFAAGNFIRSVINREDIIVNGDGTPFRSYLYAADLAVWLWKILFNGNINSPYNVGSNQSINIYDLAKIIAKSDPKYNKKIIVKKLKSDSESLRYVPCTRKAKNELGLEIFTNFNKSLTKTLEFYREKHNYINF